MQAHHTRRTVRRLAASIGLALCASLASAAPTLFLSVLDEPVSAGGSFTVELQVRDAVDLYAWELDLRFDPALVSLVEQAGGGFFDAAGPSLFLPGTPEPASGQILFAAGSLQGSVPGADGSGVLARFGFQALGGGVAAFSLANALLLDSRPETIEGVTLSGLSVTIAPGGGPSPVPAPGTLALVLPLLLPLLRPRLASARRRLAAAGCPPQRG